MIPLRMAHRLGSAALVLAVVAAIPDSARANYFDDHFAEPTVVGSPEFLAIELRIGPYVPDVGNASFEEVFGDDDGLLLAFEFDVLPFRIPYLGLIGGGVGLGWAGYSGGALVAGTNERTDEDTELDLVPLSMVGVLRVDVLARELGIPFVVTGKLGTDYVSWSSSTGSADEGSGANFGLRWAIQGALELDVFDLGAARALDEEWGINHTFVFFELFGSAPSGSPPLGDTTWALGLGAIL